MLTVSTKVDEVSIFRPSWDLQRDEEEGKNDGNKETKMLTKSRALFYRHRQTCQQERQTIGNKREEKKGKITCEAAIIILLSRKRSSSLAKKAGEEG